MWYKPDVTQRGNQETLRATCECKGRDQITAHKSRENSTVTPTILALIQATSLQREWLSTHKRVMAGSTAKSYSLNTAMEHPCSTPGTASTLSSTQAHGTKASCPQSPAQLTPNLPRQNWVRTICILSQLQVWPIH